MRHHDFIRDPARLCENRSEPDRPYDEINCGHVVHINGSLIASMDRTFLGGAARLVIEMHESAKAERAA